MPPKTAKPKIPDIPWGDNNDQLVWAFITECEKMSIIKSCLAKRRPRRYVKLLGVLWLSRKLPEKKQTEHQWRLENHCFQMDCTGYTA
jgi:hypothetical protein